MSKAEGFTLIELLIVIAIIGILAGVVITVINPTKQREKAKDAILESTVAKLSMLLEAYYSANFQYPNRCVDIQSEGLSISCSYGQTSRYFDISRVDLPSDCTGWYYGSGGSRQCRFIFFGGDYTGNQNYIGCVVAKTFSKNHNEDGAYIIGKFGKVIRAPNPWGSGCLSITR